MNEMSDNYNISLITPKSSPFSIQSSSSPRSELYKNGDKNLKQLRRRRSDTIIELRKQKKESNNDRRRNISCYDFWSDNEDIEEEEEEINVNAFQIIEVIKTADIVDIPHKYVRRLRKLTPKGLESRNTNHRELMQLLISEDFIIKLNNCLTNEDSSMSLLYEVVAFIAHLCSGDKEQTFVVVKSGVVPNLLSLMSYDNFGVIEQSVLALTYIWNSSPEMIEMLSATDFLKNLVAIIDSETSVSPSKYVKIDTRIGLVRGLSWALFVFCQNHDQMAYKLSVHLIPYFLKLLKYSDTEVKINVLKTLSVTTERIISITEDETSPVLKMVQSLVSNDSLFSTIIEYLSSTEGEVVLNAIRIVGNIVSWGEAFTQIVIQGKALQRFGLLLNHHNPKVQREAAFTVSNITAGNLAQIQAVIDAKLIPPIVELLYMGDYRTQVEASHVLLNISALGSFTQIYYILNIDNTIAGMDVIDAMVTLITSQDASVINTCLQFYNNLLVFAKKGKILNPVLKRCDNSSLLYNLELLQSYKNCHIAVLATHIFDEFFSSDLSFEEDISLDTSLTTDDKKMETHFSF